MPSVQLVQQGTLQSKAPPLEKPVIEVAEGSPGLQTDDILVIVSLEIWFDLISNRAGTTLEQNRKRRVFCT